ncbi:TRAP transporter small permease subunit [Ferrimonas sediminicola]|uniref:TRAP transporter small permease protein n=2 Tax=Ferrimonas sediminicola TaxID=2569538 RepID=A0A4U1BHN7_9GAMM|nr:TRAP transporter small permease subunit [Ferrimonas sediminicola]
MLLCAMTVVLLRYGLALGSIALQESVLYLHGSAFALGAAFTLKRDGHVRVDIFYREMSPRRQAGVNVIALALFVLPSVGLIAYLSWDYVLASWGGMEGSAEAGGLPLVYLQKSLLLLLCLTLGLQGVAELLRNLMCLGEGP